MLSISWDIGRVWLMKFLLLLCQDHLGLYWEDSQVHFKSVVMVTSWISFDIRVLEILRSLVDIMNSINFNRKLLLWTWTRVMSRLQNRSSSIFIHTTSGKWPQWLQNWGWEGHLAVFDVRFALERSWISRIGMRASGLANEKCTISRSDTTKVVLGTRRLQSRDETSCEFYISVFQGSPVYTKHTLVAFLVCDILLQPPNFLGTNAPFHFPSALQSPLS